MYGQAKPKVRCMPGTSTSTAAPSTGASETTPATDGVLRCVPKDNGRLFGYLIIRGYRGYIPLFAAYFFGAVLAHYEHLPMLNFCLGPGKNKAQNICDLDSKYAIDS